MSETEKPSRSFSDFLSRDAAVRDLAHRQRLASIRLHLDQAPKLRSLSQLWTGPQTALFGAWGLAAELNHLANHQQIDFIGADLPRDADDLKLMRKVKLKVDKPFVISVSEVDEYCLYQVRALGGDAVLLTTSKLNVVELQYFIEFGRDLGLQTVLWCASEQDVDKLRKTDARLVAGPAKMQATIQALAPQRLAILFIESIAEVADLIKTDQAIGVMLHLDRFQSA
ncbi:MAG: hypothetical protein ACOH5I_14615 [Oligoflexus sp.]